MRLHTLLSRLPYTLLLSSFTFAVTAAPAGPEEPELTVLTPDNFKQTISKGVW